MSREKLKNFRKETRKSCEEMAELLEISISMYKQIECGSRNPSITTLRKFKTKFPTADVSEIFLT